MARNYDPSATGAEGRSCPVSSSAVAAISYDPNSQNLIVTFKQGRPYAYLGVSPQRYQALCQANSKGRYVNSQIKGRYPYRKLG